MIIKKPLLEQLAVLIPDEPPETGGILGCEENGIITHIVLDKGLEVSGQCCSYYPNVTFLNQCIETWMALGIRFWGLFHTHFAGVETLSKEDFLYIQKIMMAMPPSVTELLFPVYVLPERYFVSYKARRNDCRVFIERDSVNII